MESSHEVFLVDRSPISVPVTSDNKSFPFETRTRRPYHSLYVKKTVNDEVMAMGMGHPEDDDDTLIENEPPTNGNRDHDGKPESYTSRSY